MEQVATEGQSFVTWVHSEEVSMFGSCRLAYSPRFDIGHCPYLLSYVGAQVFTLRSSSWGGFLGFKFTCSLIQHNLVVAYARLVSSECRLKSCELNGSALSFHLAFECPISLRRLRISDDLQCIHFGPCLFVCWRKLGLGVESYPPPFLR